MNSKLARLLASQVGEQWHKVQLQPSPSVPLGLILGQNYLTTSLMTWLVGLSAPSASLHKIQNQGKWPFKVVVLPFRGSSQCWRKRLTELSLFQQRELQLHKLFVELPQTLVANCLKSILAEEDLGFLADTKLNL